MAVNMNMDEQARMEMVAGLEIEMMTDMYNRLTDLCFLFEIQHWLMLPNILTIG